MGLLAPSLIAFCIVVIIPTCIGFFYSLTNWNGIVGSDIKFVGFQNFIDILREMTHLYMLFIYCAFSVCAVVLVNFVGFALALLVTQKFRGATLLRGIFFMPNMIGGLLLGFTWQFIFISILKLFKKTGIAAFSGWLSNGNRIYRIVDFDCVADVGIYDDRIYCADSADTGIG